MRGRSSDAYAFDIGGGAQTPWARAKCVTIRPVEIAHHRNTDARLAGHARACTCCSSPRASAATCQRMENWRVAQRRPMPSIAEEVASRRTFAIISHPDAGKTTLTEKLLCTAEPSSRQARSRARERQARRVRLDGDREAARYLGHFVGAAVQLRGCCVNILDTPGHQDFSRTPTAP